MLLADVEVGKEYLFSSFAYGPSVRVRAVGFGARGFDTVWVEASGWKSPLLAYPDQLEPLPVVEPVEPVEPATLPVGACEGEVAGVVRDELRKVLQGWLGGLDR